MNVIKNKYTIIPLIILFTILLFVYMKNDSNKKTPVPTGPYLPPTQQEINSGNEKKTEIVENQSKLNSKSENSSNKPKTVTVIISNHYIENENLYINAFTPQTIEKGTCTFTLTSNNKVVEKKTEANPDASSTICTQAVFDKNSLKDYKSWNLKVTFNSNNSQGVSTEEKVDVN